MPAHLCAHRAPDGTEPGGTGWVGSDKKINKTGKVSLHTVTETRHRAVTWAARGSGRAAGCQWGRCYYLPRCEDQGVRVSGKHALLPRPHRAPDLLSPPSSSSSNTPWGPTLSCSLLSPRACPRGPRPGHSPAGHLTHRNGSALTVCGVRGLPTRAHALTPRLSSQPSAALSTSISPPPMAPSLHTQCHPHRTLASPSRIFPSPPIATPEPPLPGLQGEGDFSGLSPRAPHILSVAKSCHFCL